MTEILKKINSYLKEDSNWWETNNSKEEDFKVGDRVRFVLSSISTITNNPMGPQIKQISPTMCGRSWAIACRWPS